LPAVVSCHCFRSDRTPRSPPFPYTTLFRSDVASWRLIASLSRRRTLPQREFTHQLRKVPIPACAAASVRGLPQNVMNHIRAEAADRKSTRLNSSHVKISYAVFCLKKKKHQQ